MTIKDFLKAIKRMGLKSDAEILLFSPSRGELMEVMQITKNSNCVQITIESEA